MRWHLSTESLSIGKKQLEMLRLMQNEKGESLADNFRPLQQNKNTVYYCSANHDFPDNLNNIFERIHV